MRRLGQLAEQLRSPLGGAQVGQLSYDSGVPCIPADATRVQNVGDTGSSLAFCNASAIVTSRPLLPLLRKTKRLFKLALLPLMIPKPRL